MEFKKEIVKLLQKNVNSQLDFEKYIEVPPDSRLGDYAFPCFLLAKEFKNKPQVIAEELAESIVPNKYVESIQAIGPYLNFFLNKSVFAEKVLKEIHKRKSKYGSTNLGKNKKVVIDFSAPNIAKPFSIAHLRSTVIGHSLYQIYNFLGYQSVGINHLGDWGTQFGKLIVGYKKWGNVKELHREPIKHLLDVYVKFHDEAEKDEFLNDEARLWFRRLEEGDRSAKQLWNLFKNESLKEFKRLYKRLGVKFDSYDGESFYIDKVNPTLDLLNKKGLTYISDDALVIDCIKDAPPCIIRKRDGATTYPARDLCAAIYRYNKYKFVKMIYVVDVRQSFHFNQVFGVLKRAEFPWANNIDHVKFGLMQFEGGETMSTRKGKIVFLEEVLDKVVNLVKDTIKQKNPHLKNKDKVAEMVGLGAIFFWDLSHDRVKDITFDWKNVLDFEGETGPYLQYGYARASSILKKGRVTKFDSVKFNLIEKKDEMDLMKLFNDFEEVVIRAAKENKPSIIARYLLDLTQKFNEFYHSCHCLNAKDKDLKKTRLFIVSCFKQVLGNGLKLLGIKSPEEM